MLNWRHVGALIEKEWMLEWRQKYALGGILLYVVSTVYVVYAAAINISAPLWNVLFWIVALFSGINAVVKSFVQENGNRQLYYYTLVHPLSVVVAKMIYNTLLLLIIIFLTSIALGFFAGWPVKNYSTFALVVVAAAVGFSVSLTFISGIASKAANSATLMAILSFPVMIPILATLIRLSTAAIGLTSGMQVWREVSILLGIDILLIALALVLFPYLWRD